MFLRLALALSISTLASADPRPMTLIDVMNVPTVSDPQISPDGRQILYVKSDPDWKADRRIMHIWKINADGSGAMQMTSGADGENSPRWSPDGKTIAFIAKRGTEPEAVAQIFVISIAGGEAKALTTHATAVMNITWSPDGSEIFFRAADPKSDEQKSREKAKDDVFMFDENYQQQHLWNVGVASKAEHRVTQGNYTVLSYELSRDGKKIAMHRSPTPQFEDNEFGEVWVMDATGANAKQITRNRVPESNASISPDGSKVMFLSQANEKFDTYYNAKIFVASTNGGDSHVLMPELPYEVDRAAWSKDGKSIYFLANMGVHSELFKVGVESRKPEQITSGKHALAGWTLSTAANVQVYTSSEMTSPGEVWIMGADGGSAPHKVTSVFDYLTRDFKLPRQEKVEWKGADGVTVEGLLYYPIDYKERSRSTRSPCRPTADRRRRTSSDSAECRTTFPCSRRRVMRCCSRTIADPPAMATSSCATWSDIISRMRISTCWPASIT